MRSARAGSGTQRRNPGGGPAGLGLAELGFGTKRCNPRFLMWRRRNSPSSGSGPRRIRSRPRDLVASESAGCTDCRRNPSSARPNRATDFRTTPYPDFGAVPRTPYLRERPELTPHRQPTLAAWGSRSCARRGCLGSAQTQDMGRAGWAQHPHATCEMLGPLPPDLQHHPPPNIGISIGVAM